jgi:Na+-transporting methylmalonyl-CoA/oxaloacetate decarboxylase gamma subunit
MTNLEFGLTLTVLGMGGTMIILFLIGLVVDLLNKILQRVEKKEEAQG